MAAFNDGDIYGAAESLGVTPDEILDFSSNVNPLPIPEAVRAALAESADLLGRYPDVSARRLRELAATRFGVYADEVSVGNGETEFLYAILRAFKPRRVAILAPCSQLYWRAAEQAGAECEGILSAETHEFIPQTDQVETRIAGADMVFIGNPNDPTGVALPAETIRKFMQRFPETIFVVDESYVEFVPERSEVSLLGQPLLENALVLRTCSPLLGVPGLRIGFMVASREVCALVDRVREPWTVGAMALRMAEVLMENSGDIATLREPVIGERERLRDALSRLPGLRVFRSHANFMLLKITRPSLNSTELCDRMLKQKILVRNIAGFRGLDGKFLRISVRTAPDNDRLVEAFHVALDEGKWK